MASHGLTVGFIWLIVTGFTGPATAQHTIPAQPSELILRGGTREVLLPFVVRDKLEGKSKTYVPKKWRSMRTAPFPRRCRTRPVRCGGEHQPAGPSVAAARPSSWSGSLVFGFQLRFELAVGRLFEIELQPLPAFAPGVPGARAVFLQAAPQKEDCLGIFGSTIQQRSKSLRALCEVSSFPKSVSHVEIIVGIGGISPEGAPKVIQSARFESPGTGPRPDR